LIGATELVERRAGCQSRLAAIEAGLLRRELYVATPESPINSIRPSLR
jgi:hypothetical protein